MIDAGNDLTLHARARAVPQPTYRWFRNGVEIPGADRAVLRLQNVSPGVGGNYTVEVTNTLGTASATVASVTVIPPATAPGAVDIDFYTGAGPNGPIEAMAVQPDNRVVIGGTFSSVDSLPKDRLARLMPNGSLDESFHASLPNGRVRSLLVRPNGKVLVGGEIPDAFVRQLNSDGSLDGTFQTSDSWQRVCPRHAAAVR